MQLPFYRNTFLSDVGFFVAVVGMRWLITRVQKFTTKEFFAT